MIPVVLTVSLDGVLGDQIHWTDEETGLREVEQLTQGHTVSGSDGVTTQIGLTAEGRLLGRSLLALFDRWGNLGPGVGLSSCSLGAPLVFLSISVSPQEAEVGGVPKMGFRPILAKEASIFTAETAFLFPWALLGQVFSWSPPQDGFSLPGVWPGPRSRGMQNSRGGSQATIQMGLCVCEISWHIHLGAQAVRWPQIGARSRGDQDGDGEPPPGEPARGWAPRPGPIATILQSRPCPPEMEALGGRKECASR